MTTEQRREEVAAILASSIVRWLEHQHHSGAGASAARTRNERMEYEHDDTADL
ncbi:hypothetical protein [Haliangium ochraceum]|nr:hypothetical protein [Haliangium ochraceum]